MQTLPSFVYLIPALPFFGLGAVSACFATIVFSVPPTIMAGVNHTMMLALSMVVIAAMIGAGGLGRAVWQSIQRLEAGAGFEAGIGIVIPAVILDRVTQAGRVRPHAVS